MRRELPATAATAIIVLVVALAGLIFWRFAGTGDPAHLPREEVMAIWKKAGGAPPSGYKPKDSDGQANGIAGGASGVPTPTPR